MELEGTQRFSLKPEELWELLRDPWILQQALPSFTEIHKNENEDRWEIRFTIIFGQLEVRFQNTLIGTYRGEARVRDEQWPNSYWLHITGAGGPGSAAADGRITFSKDDEGTLLEYRGDVTVQGGFLGLGGRIMGVSMRLLISQFFKGLNEVLISVVDNTSEHLDEKPQHS
jgi:carbon monoxide dehydrogenase subunit G